MFWVAVSGKWDLWAWISRETKDQGTEGTWWKEERGEQEAAVEKGGDSRIEKAEKEGNWQVEDQWASCVGGSGEQRFEIVTFLPYDSMGCKAPYKLPSLGSLGLSCAQCRGPWIHSWLTMFRARLCKRTSCDDGNAYLWTQYGHPELHVATGHLKYGSCDRRTWLYFNVSYQPYVAREEE